MLDLLHPMNGNPWSRTFSQMNLCRLGERTMTYNARSTRMRQTSCQNKGRCNCKRSLSYETKRYGQENKSSMLTRTMCFLHLEIVRTRTIGRQCDKCPFSLLRKNKCFLCIVVMRQHIQYCHMGAKTS